MGEDCKYKKWLFAAVVKGRFACVAMLGKNLVQRGDINYIKNCCRRAVLHAEFGKPDVRLVKVQEV